jgi:peroxiredoxin
MARTESKMLPLGTTAPSFRLPDTDGRLVSLDDLKGSQGYLIMFICNHCPYVKHVRQELARLGDDYSKKGIAVVAINSNDIISYPDDRPEMMAFEKKEQKYNFPYLFDETQEVAKAYSAACTPDFYLFNGEKKLVYRGQLDDSRPGSGVPVTGKDLRNALDAVLSNKPVSAQQRPSLGCNIKWKS